jgi:hypothetical protein
MHAPHHWGEPLFGYYTTDDRWVLRRHAQMLADAGVDTLIFDTSNKVTYRPYYTALLEAFREERRAGNATPQVAFLTPFWDPKSTVQTLYDDLYKRGLFKELWFHWQGKPLILADPAKVNPDLLSFFTFRRPQPSYFEGPTQPNMWSWLEVYPQHVFHNDRGEKEQMSVGVAQNAVGRRLATLSEPGARGRSFHGGKHAVEPKASLWGHNVAEQWKRALQEDPKFIFITGWNEWYGGRFDEFNKVKAPVMFVDTFDQENSRDIEPMKGGYGDNYYYQMVDAIRRFKGARKRPLPGPPATIDLDGGFSAWKDVQPEFRDAIGDTYERDHPGYNTATRYIDRTGRNDLVLMKVARDDKFLYFYARTTEPITESTEPGWMLLFINIDADHQTGWQGYDYRVNRRIKDDTTTVLEQTRNGWNWQPKADVEFRLRGNELMLAIPRGQLGVAEPSSLHFEFKWADNIRNVADTNEFLLHGDSAPPGRFNFLYAPSHGRRQVAAAEDRAGRQMAGKASNRQCGPLLMHQVCVVQESLEFAVAGDGEAADPFDRFPEGADDVE